MSIRCVRRIERHVIERDVESVPDIDPLAAAFEAGHVDAAFRQMASDGGRPGVGLSISQGAFEHADPAKIILLFVQLTIPGLCDWTDFIDFENNSQLIVPLPGWVTPFEVAGR